MWFKYILKIKNEDFKGSLELFKDEKILFDVEELNNLIKLWVEKIENKNDYFSEEHYKITSIPPNY